MSIDLPAFELGAISTSSMLAVSTVELTIRMVVGLVVVVGLLAVLSRLARRALNGRLVSRPAIAIRHQQRLDRHASVTLLEAGDRTLLVGTTGQSIVLLAEGADLASPSTEKPDSGRADDTTAATPSEPTIDIRSRGLPNPIRALQNKTVRRG